MVFELWRQDDNGNRFLIGAFTDRADAERQLAELMRKPHKQTYWIVEQKTQPPSIPPYQGGSR